MSIEGWRDVVGEELVYQYLDDLRESGVTNMFGAGSYLRDRFPELTKVQAQQALIDWMNSFADRHPSE